VREDFALPLKRSVFRVPRSGFEGFRVQVN